MRDGTDSSSASTTQSGNKARLRAGSLVLRPGASSTDPEVLLVSRRRAPDSFTVPAGKFEHDVDEGSFEACALRETIEEAGVAGTIIFDLGWHTGLAKDHSETRTRFFAMIRNYELPNWAEEGERKRSWHLLSKAHELVSYSQTLIRVLRQLDHKIKERAEVGDPLDPHLELPGHDRPMRPSRSALSMSSDDSMCLPETEDNSLDQSTTDRGTPASSTRRRSGLPVSFEEGAGFVLRQEVAPLSQARTSSASRNLSPQTSPPASLVANAAAQGPPVGCSPAKSLQRKGSHEERARVQIEDKDGERFCFYGNQVGGHFCLVKPAPENSIISVKPPGLPGVQQREINLPAREVVLKPLDEKEHTFYKFILEQVPAFLPHMPPLFGTKTLSTRQVSAMTAEVDKMNKVQQEENFLGERMRSHQYQTYIVLQDLASSMEKPRILDLKMGFKQRSQRHSKRKRERSQEKAANSTSHRLGFRICGIHIEDRTYDKYWGRRLPVTEMLGILAGFFLHESADALERNKLVTCILDRVQGLRTVVAKMLHWRFWNTSLLFCFDAANLGGLPEVRMIDFAHCTRVQGETPDHEMLSALINIEAFLEALRDGHPYDPWIMARLAAKPDESIQDAEELEGQESPVADDDGLAGLQAVVEEE